MQANFETVLLQAAPAAQPGGIGMPVILMVGMFVVMYFFMIRPQAKKAKEQKKFAESMGSGEQVITTAGIHGRINRVNEDGTLQIEISRGTFMTIERSAVSMEMTAAYRKKADVAAGITAPTTATVK
jgi:preprotein translocase subunit YajC